MGMVQLWGMSYAVNGEQAALTAARTMIMITAPADALVVVPYSAITNQDNETSEQLHAAWYKVTTIGSGAGTSFTPKPTQEGFAAAGSTVVVNLTVEPDTLEANSEIGLEGFGSVDGWQYPRLPSQSPVTISPGDTWALKVITSSYTALGVQAYCEMVEIGG